MISQLDRHFLEEEILTELDKEEEGYSPDKAADNISSTSSNSGLKSMSCTTTEKEETSSETNSEEDGSWLFDQLIFLVQKNLVKTFTSKLRLCSSNIKTPLAKLMWI